MIRVYFLPVETIDSTEQVAGIKWIYDALLDTTEDPSVRKLTQDTTFDEHAILLLEAISCREPTQEEIDRFNTHVEPYVPDADTLRAEELLASSPDAITMPEIWELLRIFGRRLSYDF